MNKTRKTTRLGKYVNELRRKTTDELLAKRAKDLVRRWRDMIQENSPVPTSAASGLQAASLTDQNLKSNSGLNTVLHQTGGPIVNPALHSSSSPGPPHHATTSRFSPSTIPGGILLSHRSQSIMKSSMNSSSNVKCPGINLGQSSLSSSDGNSSAVTSQPTFSNNSLVSDLSGNQFHPSVMVNIDPVPRTHASNKRLRKCTTTIEGVRVKKRSCLNGQMARSLDFQKSYTSSQPDLQCDGSRDSIGGLSQSSSSCELIPLHKVPITESVFDIVTAVITTTASTTTTTATISTATPTVTTLSTSICAAVMSTSIVPVVSDIDASDTTFTYSTPTTNTHTTASTSVTATAPTIITTSATISSTDTTSATFTVTTATNLGTSAVVPTGLFSAGCIEASKLPDNTAASIVSSTPIKIPGKRGRKKHVKLNNSSDSTGGMSSGSAGDILKEKIASKVRTSKVKTTQELVAFVQGKLSGVPGEKLADTKVPICKTSLKECVVKWGDPRDALEVTRNKNEHIVKFLQSQSQLHHLQEDPFFTPSADLDDLRLLKHLGISHTDNSSENYNLSPTGMSSLTKDIHQTLSSKDSLSASVVVTNVHDQTVEEILARLPPVDTDAICWDDLAKDVELKTSINKEMTEDVIAKLQVEHVEGMNGNINEGAKPGDGNSDFREWHETLSKKSYQGEFLHILPYVIID